MKLMYLLVALVFSISAKGQTDSINTAGNEVYTYVEQMPQFPGGEDSLVKFVINNTHYPAMGRGDIHSDLELRFIVNEDGSVSDIKVIKSIGPAIDAEAIRVIKELPKFTPGYQHGKPVKVYYNLPVTLDFK